MNTTETEKITTLNSSIAKNQESESISDDDDEVVEVIQTLNKESCSNSNSDSDSESIEDDDEPLNYPPKFTCEICKTQTPVHDTFRVKGCDHFYCSSCVGAHVTKKIQESVTVVTCPVSGCEGFLEMESCREILGSGVYEKWGDLLCEGVILGDERLNCPFGDCGALLINDGGVVRESECPYCWRLFCVQCRVPWHGDVDCATFQMMRI